MKNILAVIDTNVLVSALITHNPNAATVQVVEKIFDEQLTPVVNDEIIQEYADVLVRPKFKLNSEPVHEFVSAISSMALHLDRTKFPEELFPTPKIVFFMKFL